MHASTTEQPTTAAEITALEARLRGMADTARTDPNPGISQDAAEHDMAHLVGIAEAGPSVITLAQRYAILVPAAAGIGLHGATSPAIRDAAARIDHAFAVRGIPAPRLTALLPDPVDAATIAPALTRFADHATAAPTPASAVAPAPAVAAPTDVRAAITPEPVATVATVTTEPVDIYAPDEHWPFGQPENTPATDTDEPLDAFAEWVAGEITAGRTVTGRAAAAHLGVSDRTGRRRLDALKVSRPDIFTPPETPAVPPVPPAPAPAPDPTPEIAPPVTAAPAEVVTVAELDEDLEVTQIRPRHPVAPSIVIARSTAGPITLTGTGVIGRRPTGDGQHIVFPDLERSVSKTHLAYTVDVDGLTITDLHSGNGTRIHRAGHPIDCIPGQTYRVTTGDVVELGDQHFTLPA